MPSKTVLIVDDNEIILKTLTAIFEGAGFSVLGAPNARSAFGLFRDKAVDLVLLDFALPDDGEWVGPEMKRMKSGVPIAVFSGDPAAAKALSFADALIAKPESPEILLATVRKLMDTSERQAA
ncbi:MAG TPA: response regulator [Terriglobales bacterium]|nr:response regulator [Terriglobales bacterium]